MTMLISPQSPSQPPIPALMTAEEFVRRYPDQGYELVRGVVKELPMAGGEHGVVCQAMARLLGNHVVEHSLGRVLINDTHFITRRNPDEIRGMDVAYISYARLARGAVPRGPLTVPPELIVEARSPSDLWTDVFAKVEEYLAAGVNVVIVLNPETRTASVCRPKVDQTDFQEDQTLTIPDILPGFAVEVSRLFE